MTTLPVDNAKRQRRSGQALPWKLAWRLLLLAAVIVLLVPSAPGVPSLAVVSAEHVEGSGEALLRATGLSTHSVRSLLSRRATARATAVNGPSRTCALSRQPASGARVKPCPPAACARAVALPLLC